MSTPEFAQALAAISTDIHHPVCAYINRRGQIVRVAVPGSFLLVGAIQEWLPYWRLGLLPGAGVPTENRCFWDYWTGL